MDVLLRDNIKKYKDNIAYSKKKLNCMRSKNDSNQHGGFPYKKMEDVLHNTIKFKDTNTQVQNLYDIFDNFDKQLNQYVMEINTVHGLITDPALSDMTLVSKKLKQIEETVNAIINAHTMTKDVFPQPEIIQITKQDGYDKVSLIYQGMLENHKKLIDDIRKNKDHQNLDFIYKELDVSIGNQFVIIEQFDRLLDSTSQQIYDNSFFEIDDFDSIDLAKTKNEIYNYTKRLYITESQNIISPRRIDIFVSMTQDILFGLKEVSSFQLEPNEIITNEYYPYQSRQSGGTKRNEIILQMTKDIITLGHKLQESGKKIELYNDLLIKYKLFKIQLNHFILYLALIALSPKMIKNMIVYTHINKGICQFYLSIIESLLEQIALENRRIDVIYFQQNHYITLLYMQKFLKFLISNMKTLDLVDIDLCSGNVKKGFIILNHFKDILESYHETWQSKVTVYSRINDWNDGSLPTSSTDKMFSRDDNDARVLNVNKSICKKKCAINCDFVGDGTTKIKFSEVFDTENFQRNNDITKYMTLETQLSKKKGVMLMTYGYSGTGKTFTLFGSSKESKQGLLQSTLNNIRGLSEVRFRVLELYGLGVQYPHYWKRIVDIKQHVITYDLEINDDDEITIMRNNIETNIKHNFEDANNKFISLKENKVENTFKKFDKFIDSLDKIRKENGRIRITANNPESSRSIVIYEFHLLIEESYVPFIIIDLPGREEIVETYVDNYLNRPFIPEEKKTPFYKALLSSMSVNPLGLAILSPSIIFETFNNLTFPERKKIADTILIFENSEHYDVETQDDQLEEESKKGNAGTLQQENLGVVGAKRRPVSLSYIYKFDDTLWENERKFTMVSNPHYMSQSEDNRHVYQDKIVNIKGAGTFDKSRPTNTNQVDVGINSVQYQSVLAIHLMNRLILLNRFDVIEKIYMNVIKTYFDMSRVIATIGKDTKQKREFLYKYFEKKEWMVQTTNN